MVVRRIAVVLLWLAPAVPAQSVRFLDHEGAERQLPALVISETLEQVDLTGLDGGARPALDSAAVLAIDYGPGSEAYELGRLALARGDAFNAVAQLTLASREESPAWQAPVALLALAEAQALAGERGADGARAALAEFFRRHPEHRRLPEALLLQGRLASDARDTATLLGSLETLRTLVRQGRIGAAWGARALQLQAEAELAAGRPAEARRCFAELRLAAGSDPAASAAASNGLAECDFQEPGRMKQAQLGFARVATTAWDVPDERARALCFLGRCAEALGPEEPDGVQRAAAYQRELTQRYPASTWARTIPNGRP